MKPNVKNLITKGLLSVKTAISLLTKGLLDEYEQIIVKRYIRGRRKIRGYAFNKFYYVKGKSFTKLELICKIIGIKELFLNKEIKLKASKILPLNTDYNLQGILQKTLELRIEIVAKLGKNLRQDFSLKGQKQIEYNLESNLKGIKQFSFIKNNNLIAVKQFNILNTASIYGTKAIKTDNDITIKGKRDITNILVALDIIE